MAGGFKFNPLDIFIWIIETIYDGLIEVANAGNSS
jgi:hypothetical protein